MAIAQWSCRFPLAALHALFILGMASGCNTQAETSTRVTPQQTPHTPLLSEQADQFHLDDSPLLKGFMPAKSKPHEFGTMVEEAPFATWVVNTRYFHGPSELTYSVLLFPTQQALKSWDAEMAATAPGWFTPLQQPLNAAGTKESKLGGEIRPGEPPSTATIVNRVLVIIYGCQHKEIIRRDPKQARIAVPNPSFVQLVKNVNAELVARAKRLPSNRG